MWRGVVWLGALAACLDAGASHCADGRVCGPGTVCVAALDLCADPEQLSVCAQAADGDGCSTRTIATGTCTGGVCLSSGCGNGVVETGEACDDGNTVGADGCSADCRSNETCGNGRIDPQVGEQCDCGTTGPIAAGCDEPNSSTRGLCDLECKLRCGNGVLTLDEQCDPGLSPIADCAGIPDQAGNVFDRGVAVCSATCIPLTNPASCHYVGFRVRMAQLVPAILELAPTGADRGFFVVGNQVKLGTFTSGTLFDAGVPLLGVWAVDEQTAIAVGAGGTAVHFDGTTWTPRATGTTLDLVDVWGRASDDAYSIADDLVVHWDGLAWTSLGAPGGGFRAITGDADRIYVAGDGGMVLVHDGNSWSSQITGTADLTSIAVHGGLVVAVGANGAIVQDAGGGFVPGRSAITANLTSVVGSDLGFFVAGEQGTVALFDGRVWRALALGRNVETPTQDLIAISGTASGSTLAVIGTLGIATYEGSAWSPTLAPTTSDITGVWGSAPDDIHAVGRNGTILHHDGLTWTAVTSPTSVDLHAIWGVAADDIYAVGDDLTLLHFDGNAWSVERTGSAGGITGTLRAVYAAAHDNVHVAGTTGIFHYDGSQLVLRSVPPATSLWGASATKVWAAGPSGLRELVGAGWPFVNQVFSPVRAVFGTSATDVFGVGATSYHFDGTAWTAGPFADPNLSVIGGSTSTGLFAADQAGRLHHHLVGGVVEKLLGRSTSAINAVFAVGNVVVFAGDDGTLETLVFHR